MEHSGSTPYSSGEPSRFELILESIPLIVWVASTDGAVSYMNRQGREYAGVPIDDLLGWDWGWIVHPADLPNTLSVWNESVRTGRPHDTEFRLRRRDGEYRWFSTRGVPLRDQDGRIIRWYGVCHDIEELKQSNISLRGTQRLFKALVERNPRGFALLGMDRTIRYLSPASARITGFRPEDVVGNDGFDYAHPDDRAELACWLERLLARPGEEIEIAFRFRKIDGTYMKLAIHAVNLLPDPDVRAVVVSFWDADLPMPCSPALDD